ncbi:cytochrome P450 [Aspergillus costaricaensis CBS 115574]|uniref:Cytochrome P450 n=1 Tax=Aspergillus costaricaensis CBS 115574 TaxID=1448317 RepID=A0ACD1I930_9EURO|nr:cytochrome P450 [Aspergillus costaricaensis CBS 115574]RAK87019.1 cytochrome P450 [Aspergillus costaricaensis CBS 115574]
MAFVEELSPLSVTGVSTVFLAYLVVCIVYRLYLSPIAAFPGPPLAAVTWFYEFYYDAICGGRYIFKISDMHKRYGPIVRINPEELHIETSAFYDEIYAPGSKKRNKTSHYNQQLGTPYSTISSIGHDLHRMRRSALNPFFSKASVRRLQPVIWGKVDILLRRLNGFKNTGQPVRIDMAYAAFTNDVIMEYTFSRSRERLQKDDFGASAQEALLAASKVVHWMKHFHWLIHVGQVVPPWIVSWISPTIATVLEDEQSFARDNLAQVHQIINEADVPHGEKQSTIFHDLIANPNLPVSEKSVERLAQEAKIVVGAGTETTAWALSVITYFLLKQPDTLSRLRAELVSSISDPIAPVGIEVLEQLPYLTAVIHEGLRLSYGVVGRLARISPDDALVFHDGKRGKDWVIPPGTPMNMNSVFVHNDPAIFPEPSKFRPERWIEADKEGKRLNKYLVSFTKGSRQCVGINLAYAELYICISRIFRLYGGTGDETGGKGGMLELFETSNDDVDFAADMFIPATKEGSKGIRLLVRG